MNLDAILLMMTYGSRPNLYKKCVRLLDAAHSHEILRKTYFVVKPFKKGLNRGCRNFKCSFLLISDAGLII